ncbi:MAG: hypothetical protein AB1331_03475 [Bacillota bacterium]
MTRTESFELIDPQVLRLEGDPARYLGLGLYRDFILVGCALATLQPGRRGFLSQNWAAGSDEIRRRLLPELLAELSAHGRSDLQVARATAPGLLAQRPRAQRPAGRGLARRWRRITGRQRVQQGRDYH